MLTPIDERIDRKHAVAVLETAQTLLGMLAEHESGTCDPDEAVAYRPARERFLCAVRAAGRDMELRAPGRFS